MLALIAGTGDLPPALVARLPAKPLICALEGFEPAVTPDIVFRLETLGSLLDTLRSAGVDRLCMAGAIARPQIDPSRIDDATKPLLPVVMTALTQGDDGALRAVIKVFEDAGFTVEAAHDIAPDLLPGPGVLTKSQPADWHRADASAGQGAVADLGARDKGQACVVRMGRVVAVEGPDGTDAMLRAFHADLRQSNDDGLFGMFDAVGDTLGDVADWLSGDAGNPPRTADDGILFKAPKPAQDRRADLPVIGVGTALTAAEAGLAGIVIEAGGVMVLDLPSVVQTLDAQRMFLWVRPKEEG